MSIRIDGTNTSANPGITGSDTDTGLQFGTDEVNVVTGGSTRATVDSSGRLLVGTTTSTGSHVLEVNGGTDNEVIKVESSDAGAYIRFEDDDTTGQTRLGAVDNDFKIDVNSSERLRIDSSGKVGIGTSAPTHELQVSKSGSASAIAATSDVTSGTASRLLLGNSVGTARATFNLTGGGSELAYLGTEGNFPMYFQTNGAERMRIDSSGNVGIGTTSPAGKLTVYDSSSPYLYLQNSTSGTSASDGFSLLHSGVNTFFANRDSGYMAFETGNLERMRIDSAGIVTAGTTNTPNGGHQFDANSSNDNVGAFYVRNHRTDNNHCAGSFSTAASSTSTSNVILKFGINDFAAGSGQINANGSNQCAFGSFSDERLKENITSLPSQWDNIKNLRPVEFDFIESQGGEHQVGFIAQEFQTVYPDSIGSQPMFAGANEQSEEERLTITGWSKTEARLVKALQEAQTRIETLETQNTAQQTQINDLLSRVTALETAS